MPGMPPTGWAALTRLRVKRLRRERYLCSSLTLTEGWILLSAPEKWRICTTSSLPGIPLGRYSLRHSRDASRTSAAKSAPENLWQRSSAAMREKSTSAARGCLPAMVWRMEARSAASGRGTKSSLSSLPGRSMAGSMMSGRLVAAITYTSRLSFRPSISVRSWLTTLSLECDEELSPPLFGQSASSSSKKTMHGLDERARSNTPLTALSDSPTYLLRSSGPLTEMKLALASLAIALARSVLPQPGGP
mmetsp:Transcript_20172/g.77225  ORF Transcript_20172/g.77225 Transcript_20172/m.77225 type:complete len:247 (-) Transcript_20172:1735-2475(-)